MSFKRPLTQYGLFVLLIFSACKKEYPDYPYNTITSFRVQDNSGAVLSASIDSNSIIVYWPPLQTVPDSITPVVSISDRAVLTPASGMKIPFKEGFTYTVKAQDGSTQTFILKPVINQPPVQVLDVYPLTGPYGTDLSFRITGQYFIPDTTRTAVYLVAAGNGRQTKAVIQLPVSSSQINFTVNLPDTGKYAVRLVTGLQTVAAGTLNMTMPPPQLTFPSGATVQRGGTLTITGKYLTAVTAVVAYDADFGGPYPLTIVSKTDTSITVQIPADLNPGEYIDLSVEQGGSFYDFYVDPGSGVIVQ
jgi:hypothetical protein